jgi:hypothetical protein
VGDVGPGLEEQCPGGEGKGDGDFEYISVVKLLNWQFADC